MWRAHCRSRWRRRRTLTTVANWIYIWGHWPVIIATMLWLAWRHVGVFLRLRDGMLLSGAVGMVVFATYPGRTASAGRASAWSTP